MALTYTRWLSISTNETLQGQVFVKSGETLGNPVLEFRFPDLTYLDVTTPFPGENLFWFPTLAYLTINLSNLSEEFTGTGHTSYYNNDNEVISMSKSTFTDGLYHYHLHDANTPNDGEDEYLLILPSIENALDVLATSIINKQCGCKINASVMQDFIKAKAMLQSIYAKKIQLDTTYDETDFVSLNNDVTILQNFLNLSYLLFINHLLKFISSFLLFYM